MEDLTKTRGCDKVQGSWVGHRGNGRETMLVNLDQLNLADFQCSRRVLLFQRLAGVDLRPNAVELTGARYVVLLGSCSCNIP